MLAHWGHTVVLVDREGGRRPLAESLPPSCIPLLEAIGVRQAVDAAGFLRATGNTVWWGGAPRRVEPFPGGALGYQVLSTRLDAVLRDRAVAAGTTLLRPATARRVEGEGPPFLVTVAAADGDLALRAAWVLDCTGRTGVFSRARRSVTGSDLRTMAVVGEWERAGGWGLPDESHTLVESVPWGWGWSVPVSATRRFVTVMLDPAATALAAGPDLALRYHALLHALPALGGLVQNAHLDGAPWACDATPYASESVVSERVLAVGDAASFIDPLSSFGVKKALASGWMAAVAVHTALATPANADAALTLFAERERDYVTAATRELGHLSQQADAREGSGFWQSRASLDADEVEAASIERLRRDADVLAAFQELRQRASARLVRSPQLRITSRPMIRGNVVISDDHLALPGLPEATRYVRSVDLLIALDVATRTDDVGEMFAQYSRRLGPVALPDFLGALAVLVAKGGATFA